MNIKYYDPYLQALLLVILLVLNTFLITEYASWFILLTIPLFKIYQIIGGGGVHLWACHAIGDNKLSKLAKSIILFFWTLCGIDRASYFCKYHILHHSLCDKEGDPHSPSEHHPLVLTFGLWSLIAHKKDAYITPEIQDKIDASYKRINNSIFDKYHYIFVFSMIAISLFISPFFCLYFITLPMLLNKIDGNFFFVYWFHKEGKVRNVKWASKWILDSGSHGVHHRWLK